MSSKKDAKKTDVEMQEHKEECDCTDCQMADEAYDHLTETTQSYILLLGARYSVEDHAAGVAMARALVSVLADLVMGSAAGMEEEKEIVEGMIDDLRSQMQHVKECIVREEAEQLQSARGAN